MPEDDDTPSKAPPALFDHCVKTYKMMLSEAKPITQLRDLPEAVEGDAELRDYDPEQIIVYEGFFTQLITSRLNLSVPYYTQITRALIRMGCVRQLKRGGGTSPSQWELIYEPTLDAFLNSRPAKVPKQTKDEMYLEMFDELNARISKVEALNDRVLQALAEQFGTEEALDGAG